MYVQNVWIGPNDGGSATQATVDLVDAVNSECERAPLVVWKSEWVASGCAKLTATRSKQGERALGYADVARDVIQPGHAVNEQMRTCIAWLSRPSTWSRSMSDLSSRLGLTSSYSEAFVDIDRCTA